MSLCQTRPLRLISTLPCRVDLVLGLAGNYCAILENNHYDIWYLGPWMQPIKPNRP